VEREWRWRRQKSRRSLERSCLPTALPLPIRPNGNVGTFRFKGSSRHKLHHLLCLQKRDWKTVRVQQPFQDARSPKPFDTRECGSTEPFLIGGHGRTGKRLAGLEEGDGRGLSRPYCLGPDRQEGTDSRCVDARVVGVDLRGGGPSARNHRLRGEPHGLGERMASASLPKERAGGGLQGSA
jgi:hypothetical protein